MRPKPALAVGLTIAAVAFFGTSFTGDYSTQWYKNLNRPEPLTPNLEQAIPFIWGVIYFLTGVALANILAIDRGAIWKCAILILMLIQLILNYSYSVVFTTRQDLPGALTVAASLSAITAIIILLCAARRVPVAVACLLPYLCWATFATYLASEIARLNR